MEIKLYGLPNCPKCEEIKAFLTSKSIAFSYSNDFETTAIIGSKYRLRSSPILVQNDKAYSYNDILSKIEDIMAGI